jgi:hypothetical protein
MKKYPGIMFLLGLFFGIVSLSKPSNVWASAFTISDTQYEIAGYVGSPEQENFFGQYDIASQSPLFYEMADTTQPSNLGTFAYSKSIAAGPYVYVAIDQPMGEGVPGTGAAAWSRIDFTPTFDGYIDKDILFYGQSPYESWFGNAKVSWRITDLTSNNLVSYDWTHEYRGLPFSQELMYGVYDPVNGNATDYYWDSSHTYELELLVQTGSNHCWDLGWLTTDMFTVNVPEPATMLLLVCGLVGLAGLKRKFRK